MRTLTALALIGLLAPAASAQLGKELDKLFALETLLVNNGLLGIEVGPGADPANPGTLVKDYLWVSGRKTATDPNHMLYQVDIYAKPFNLVAKYPQPTAVTASAWGIRDLAYDITTNLIYGGTDTANSRFLHAFDAKNLKWDASKDVPAATSLACIRAVAVDPFQKLFYITDWTTNIEVVDFTGKIVAAHTSQQHGGTSIYGLAFCEIGPHQGLLWSFGQGGSTASAALLPGSQCVLRLHDPKNRSAFLGQMTFGDTTTPYTGYANGGIAGGLAFVMDKTYMRPTLWCLQQSGPDCAVAIDATWAYGKGCPGSAKTVPVAGVTGDAPYRGNAAWTLKVSDIAGATAAFLWVGLDTAMWAGLPLPFDLSFLGMPGCAVNSGWNFLLGSGLVTAGEASVGVPIPNNAALAGASLYFQWFISDPVPGAAPFITSPSCGVTIK